GDNFAAGMTGGMAFVYDPGDELPLRINPDSVVYQRLASAHWEDGLKSLVAEHARETDSARARRLIDEWDTARERFWQVCPKEMLARLDHPLSDEAAAETA
ncbi:MAG: hypothetical protein ACE5H8_11755, partial [Alphaproteobacteria bacterium]